MRPAGSAYRCVNILFVNYGDFTTNSLNHIGGFANTLCAMGHACVVTVPEGKETICHIPAALFIAASFEEALAKPGLFPDGRPAEIVHTWTPRESVRRFTLAYLKAAGNSPRLVVHLEDSERFLIESYTGKSLAELRKASPAEIDAQLIPRLPHPLRHETFLRAADGITHIIDRLAEFAPPSIPLHRLFPGVDFSLYHPQPPDPHYRSELRLRDDEKVIVFTGSSTFANEPEMRELYVAVALLNQRGTPTRLVRTGFNSPRFLDGLSAEINQHVLDLGFIEKAKLPRLLALADVLVQPGRRGPFNDYRLPSKLPEFLAMGKAVALPPTNLAALMQNGREAVFLSSGSPLEIAELCERLFRDPPFCASLAEQGAEFARRHFNLSANTSSLAEFYARVRNGAESTSLEAVTHEAIRSEAQLLAEIVRHLQQHPTLGQVARDYIQHAKALLTAATGNAERPAALSMQGATLFRSIRQHIKVYETALPEESHAKPPVRVTPTAELQLRHDLEKTRAVLRAREEKIKRMSSSFSWRATSPLRALRRMLLDGPPPPPLSPKLAGHTDLPKSWDYIAPSLTVRGWVVHRDGLKLKDVRARLEERVVPIELVREPLAAPEPHPDYPDSEWCGWIAKVEVPRRREHRLIVELQDEAGTWHIAFVHPLKRSAQPPPPPPESYAGWVAAFDSLTPELAEQFRAKLARLSRRPLISVLMPTYNTPEKWLVAAIESVRRQIYENWELCIADDASTASHVRRVLDRYRKKDPRIKIAHRETNGHISAASNSALALAQGEFVALFDHDDELRAHALACVALELEAHPEADLIYSDEDKIDETGARYDPYFKPDWNPDLFLTQNYVSHLGVYRTQRVKDVGGFRAGYEGSQDWDLAMRVIECTTPERVRHIPKVLYHWRSIPGSTAMHIGAKSYAVQAAEKVITEHFSRTGISATITPTKGFYWRVHYPLPQPAPRVTLMIPTRDRLQFLQPCVESLLAKTTYPDFELLILDNDSREPETLAYLDKLRSRDRVRVAHFPGEFNYSAINNFGVSQTDAPIVGLLNNDLEAIHGDWLDEMVSNAVRPEIGCVGAKLYYPDGRIQHAGVVLGVGGVGSHAWQTHPRDTLGQMHRNVLQQNLSAVTAACLVVRRTVYRQAGGLDERLKVAFNDVDFCLKVRAAGYRNLWTPYAELYHHESVSRGVEDTVEKRDRFRGEEDYVKAKWGNLLPNDPAYNPNLTLQATDFGLSFPPRPWLQFELTPQHARPS